MALSYDFDIHYVLPKELAGDDAIGGMLADIGISLDSPKNVVALFRDPETVNALRGASENVKAYFQASGFGLNVYDSGAGPGRFPAEDETQRNNIVHRLTENLPNFDLQGEDLNGFSFADFIGAIAEAQPVSMQSPEPTAPAAVFDTPTLNTDTMAATLFTAEDGAPQNGGDDPEMSEDFVPQTTGSSMLGKARLVGIGICGLLMVLVLASLLTGGDVVAAL